MTAPRPPITTHVLDSTTGLPALGVRVTLTLLNHTYSPAPSYTALTSNDGRIASWTPEGTTSSFAEIFETFEDDDIDTKMIWSLKFDTLSYWGQGKTFYPEVEVRFFVEPRLGSGPSGEGGKHYHVPVLLGPWGYTTYRGS